MWRSPVHPEVRVPDQLEERSKPDGFGTVDTHGGDLDSVHRVVMVVAVDLGIEGERPLRDLTHASFVRLVDLPSALGGDLFGRWTPRRALERPVDLVTPAGALARVRLEVEAGRDDYAESGAPAELGDDIAGARVGDAVRRCDHNTSSPYLPGERARQALALWAARPVCAAREYTGTE